jgi:hypothetical protein
MNLGDTVLAAAHAIGQTTFSVSNMTNVLTNLGFVPTLVTVYDRSHGVSVTYPIVSMGASHITVGTALIGADRSFVVGDTVMLSYGLPSAALDKAIGQTVGGAPARMPSGWQLGPTYREVAQLAGVAATTGGGIATWQPASGLTVIIRRCLIYISTPSTGAANLSVGVGSSATTSYTNLITASSVASGGTNPLDSLTLQTAASAAQALLMTAGNFVTFSGSATTVGMVAEALIEYWQP